MSGRDDWDINALLGKRIRFYSVQGRESGIVVAEGVAISWTDRPTLTVRDDHGVKHSHIIDLPFDILGEPASNLAEVSTADLLNEIAARVMVPTRQDAHTKGGMLG